MDCVLRCLVAIYAELCGGVSFLRRIVRGSSMMMLKCECGNSEVSSDDVQGSSSFLLSSFVSVTLDQLADVSDMRRGKFFHVQADFQ